MAHLDFRPVIVDINLNQNKSRNPNFRRQLSTKMVQTLNDLSVGLAFRLLRTIQMLVLILLCWSLSGLLIGTRMHTTAAKLSAGLGIWFGLLATAKLALTMCSILINNELLLTIKKKFWLDVALTLIMDITGIVYMSILSQLALFNEERRFFIYITIGSVFVCLLLDVAYLVRNFSVDLAEDGQLRYQRQKTMTRKRSSSPVQITMNLSGPGHSPTSSVEDPKLAISKEDLDNAKKKLRKSGIKSKMPTTSLEEAKSNHFKSTPPSPV